MIIEHTVTLKQDVLLEDRAGPEVVLLTLNVGATHAEARELLSAASEGFPNIAVVSADGRKQVWKDRDTEIETDLDRGGYAAFYPNFWGSLALMPLSDDLTMRVAATAEIGLERPGETLRAGTTLTTRCLVIRGRFGATDGEAEFDLFRDQRGLDGSTLHQVDVTRGELVASDYVVRLRAAEGAAAFTMTQCDLAAPVPVIVEGLGEQCHAVGIDPTTGKLRRVAVFEGAGWLTVDPSRGPISMFVGNALTCDKDGLRLNLLHENDAFSVELHNPTDQAVTAAVGVSDWLRSHVGSLDRTITIPPGASVIKDVNSKGACNENQESGNRGNVLSWFVDRNRRADGSSSYGNVRR